MSKPTETQFPTIPDQWTPVAMSRDMKKGKPLGIYVDSIPVVLFKDKAGTLKALVDQCPHRSVKLSNGKMTDQGHLQCPFHGWRFDGDGTCQHIPLHEEGKVHATKVKAGGLPAHEAGGMVWIYTAVTSEDVGKPHLPTSMLEPGWSGRTIIREWDAHWSRAIQTMLDVAHIPFVHARTIGAGLGRAIGKDGDAVIDLDLKKRDDGSYHMVWGVKKRGEDLPDDAGWLEFLPPNGMTLGIPLKNKSKEWMLHIWCVPTTEGHSNQFIVAKRNFGRFNPVWTLADAMNIMVLNEDKPNVEAAWPSRVPAPLDEISMPTDASTIAFQHYHYKTFIKPFEKVEDGLQAAE